MKGIAGLVVALGLLTAGLLAASPAQAVTFNLTSDHCTGSCGTPPFGTVTLLQSGTTVDVTVQVNSPTIQFAKTGAADFQAFKFNATGVLLTDITVNQTVAGQTLLADAGAFNGDGTGSFAFGIICSTCANGSSNKFANDIVFHVASAGIADLTTPNALGNVFVADVVNTITGNTGPVDASTAAVTEPASLGLFGTSLVLVAMLGRRWKRGEA